MSTCRGPIFSYKLRYMVGFWLVQTAVSTNQKPTMYRNLYENTGPASNDDQEIESLLDACAPYGR